jgi:tetratricopeptide (TPR) repeat protein
MKATWKAPSIALLFATSLLACQTIQTEESVSDLFRRGDFEEAYALAQTKAEEAPDDAYYAEVERMVEVAILLDEGRAQVFDGDLAGALETFFKADAAAPGHPVIRSWIGKVVGDLNDRTIRDGGTALMNGDLVRASEMYERALVFEPGQEEAKAGLARTLLLANHRKGLSEEYYKEGVRSLREYWLGRAGKEFSAVEKYAPDDKRGSFRTKQVAGLLAQDRVLMAQDLEAKELYHAARNEYRIALLIDDQCADAVDGLARMDKEVAAAAKLDEAERATIRGDFKGAKEALVEGSDMTEAQTGEFASAKIDLDEARWKKLYLAATDSEADGDYERAAKLYDQLLQETGYYEDAVERRRTALDFIKLAERLYGEAQAAKSPKARRQKLEQIAVFWPEYKNVSKLLAKKPKP